MSHYNVTSLIESRLYFTTRMHAYYFSHLYKYYALHCAFIDKVCDEIINRIENGRLFDILENS